MFFLDMALMEMGAQLASREKALTKALPTHRRLSLNLTSLPWAPTFSQRAIGRFPSSAFEPSWAPRECSSGLPSCSAHGLVDLRLIDAADLRDEDDARTALSWIVPIERR